MEILNYLAAGWPATTLRRAKATRCGNHREDADSRPQGIGKDGVVKRKDFREVPPRVEYSLAERGVELANVLRALCEWGSANFTDQIAAPQLETSDSNRTQARESPPLLPSVGPDGWPLPAPSAAER